MDVRMPDGTIIRGVPEGTPKEEIMAKYQRSRERAAVAKPGALSRIVRGAPSGALGLMEAGAELVSGAVAVPAAGLAGLAGTVLPGKQGQGARWTRSVADALTYDPATAHGELASEAINYIPKKYGQGTEFVGGLATDVTGSPAVGTAVKTTLDAGPAVLFRGRGGASRPTPKPTPKQATLAAAQREGYVVPPTSAKPSAAGSVLEGAGGKIKTQQLASQRNQAVTNRLAARELGLPEEAPITVDALQAVRKEAGQAYETVRQAGRITSDDRYALDLARITERYKGASKDFPELAKNEIEGMVEAMRKPEFDANSAVDAIRILRDKADTAFRNGDRALGGAYRDISSALEGAIERHLSRMGDDGKGMLDAFRSARERIAKTYTVEGALNASTGAVSAVKLAALLKRGKPLSGSLRTAGEFAEAFPKAAREVTESFPAYSPLDMFASISSAGAASMNPAFLAGVAYPLLGRPAARSFVLSRPGQRMLTQPTIPGRVTRYGLGRSVPIGALTAAGAAQ